MRGFRAKYEFHDDVQFVDYTTRELQEQLTPGKVLQLLREGNERFRSGKSLERDFPLQIRQQVLGQHPMAVLISGIHSRVPPETVFDVGLGDILGIRIGGNVVGPKVMASTEYGCAVAGAKLIVVMGHNGSAMVTAAADQACGCGGGRQDLISECPHLPAIIDVIRQSVDPTECAALCHAAPEDKARFVDLVVARRHVVNSLNKLMTESDVLRGLVDQGRLAAIGAMYDVTTGECEFLIDDAIGIARDEVDPAATTEGGQVRAAGVLK
jgi:carbonic anhydrase/SulP family sulfate permease